MARYPFEEFTRVVWVPGASGIANRSAPTAAEINAGTDLTCFITRDGLQISASTNGADDSTLCSKEDTETAGSVSFDIMLKMLRDNTADTAWNLVVWGDTGNLVVRRGVAYATAVAASQKVEVYSAQFGNPSPLNSASNTDQAFEVKLFNRPGSVQKATVA